MDADQRFQPGQFRNFNERHQFRHEPAPPPTLEELQEFKSCMQSSIFKAGLPFAVGVDLFNAFMKSKGSKANPTSSPPPPPPIEPWAGAKRTFVFFGSFFVGVFLYSPVCYKRLQEKYMNRQRDLLKRKEEGGIIAKAEGNILQTDDVSSYSSLDPNLDGPKSAFSHLDLDFDSTVSDNLILEDVEDKKLKQSIPETTYDDLRRRNRENFTKNFIFPAPPVRNDPPSRSQEGSVAQKQASNEPPPRRVIKNKYGDEVET